MNGAAPLPRRRPVGFTALSTSSSLGSTLPGFATALREGRSGIAKAGAEYPPEAQLSAAALLHSFSVDSWAKTRDAKSRLAVVRVLARATLSVQTAGCVALDALASANLDDSQAAATALIVAGNNLAMDYQMQSAWHFKEAPDYLRPSYVQQYLDTDAIGAISELGGLRAEGWTVGGASASAALAIIQATRLCASGHVDRCLVVAPVNALSAMELRALGDSGAMARGDGAPPHTLNRPFDEARSGFVYGQGAGAVLVEAVESARARSAAVLAEIAGYGQCLDGRRTTDPDAAGQVAAMRAALAMAAIGPDEIDYVNAHGTGSRIGDEVECKSIRTVFGASSKRLRINSTKPFVGHCLSAAAMLELIATVLQMQGGFCHGNPNLDHPIASDLPFAPKAAIEWPIHYALKNSFAFGGINSSLILKRSGE